MATVGGTISTRSHHATMVERAATARSSSCVERLSLAGVCDTLYLSERLSILLAKLDFKNDTARYIFLDFRSLSAARAAITVACSSSGHDCVRVRCTWGPSESNLLPVMRADDAGTSSCTSCWSSATIAWKASL